MTRSTSLIIILLAALAAGCSTPTRTGEGPSFDSRFGDAVRHTVRHQTYQDGDEVPPLPGDRAAEAMRLYRTGGSDGAGVAGEAPGMSAGEGSRSGSVE